MCTQITICSNLEIVLTLLVQIEKVINFCTLSRSFCRLTLLLWADHFGQHCVYSIKTIWVPCVYTKDYEVYILSNWSWVVYSINWWTISSQRDIFMKCSSMIISNAFGPKLELQVPDLFAPIWSGFSYIDEGRRSTLSTTHATLASYFDSDWLIICTTTYTPLSWCEASHCGPSPCKLLGVLHLNRCAHSTRILNHHLLKNHKLTIGTVHIYIPNEQWFIIYKWTWLSNLEDRS